MGCTRTDADKGEFSTKKDCWQLLVGDSGAEVAREVAMEELKSFHLFVVNGKDSTVDETPNPTADWKRTCARCILPEVW